MSDALDNLIAAVHLLRTDGGATLTGPMGQRMSLPTPIVDVDLATLFLALAEGWRVDLYPTQEISPPPTASPPRSTIRRRRWRLRR